MKLKNDFYPNDPFPSIISDENGGKSVNIVAIHNWGKINNWDIAAVYNVDGTNVFYLHSDSGQEYEENPYGAEASVKQLTNSIPKTLSLLTSGSPIARKLGCSAMSQM